MPSLLAGSHRAVQNHIQLLEQQIQDSRGRLQDLNGLFAEASIALQGCN